MNKTKQKNLINLLIFTVNQQEVQQTAEWSMTAQVVACVSVGLLVGGFILGGIWLAYPAALGYSVATAATSATIVGVKNLPIVEPGTTGIYYSKPVASKAVSVNPIFNMPINKVEPAPLEVIRVIHNPNELNFGPTVKMTNEPTANKVVEMANQFKLSEAKAEAMSKAVTDKIINTGVLRMPTPKLTKMPPTGENGTYLMDINVDIHVEKIAKSIVAINRQKAITKNHCTTAIDNAVNLHDLGVVCTKSKHITDYASSGGMLKGKQIKTFQEILPNIKFNAQGVLPSDHQHYPLVSQKLLQCSQVAVDFYSRMNLSDVEIVLTAFNG